MIILKLIAAAALGYAFFWVAGKLRDSSAGWLSGILDALNPMVRLVIYYASSVILLANLYIMTANSLYFLAIAIGGTIPTVMFAIEDFRDNFGR